MRSLPVASAAAGLLLFTSTPAVMNAAPDSPGFAGSGSSQVEKVPFDPSAWELVWAEEFDQGPAPDPRHWTYEVGFIRNREAQYYTRDLRENARIEEGFLVIEARHDPEAEHPITSASLTTEGRVSFLYGRIEVRARVPTGNGVWPAIWMLGENIRRVGWPRCGEIDIMEYVGFDPHRLHGNIHVDAYNHTRGTGRGASLLLERPWENFHCYAIEWSPERIDFFIDDHRYFSYENEGTGEAVWPFDAPHYLILNLAIGGGWGGRHGIDKALFPHRFEIDYVRHYQRQPDN
ncbi:MAG: glycoside hydrolase family 16 protein [Puniceicoccaceae bacterium]|nr:MAG: glycoside hydrolase family 16 protein [Puniceicoccaceae bacterium]